MDIAAIPLKPFGLAKARLAMMFDAEQRRGLGEAVAAHTIEIVRAAVGKAWVVTGDEEVAGWAESQGAGVIVEQSSAGGLNVAAAHAVEFAQGARWMIIHADLPLLSPEDVRAVWDHIPRAGFALAPSHDGGTSVFAGRIPTRAFSYGVGSFHRHVGRLRPHPLDIISRTGFLLDLDAPSDFAAATGHPRGSWLHGAIRR